jgi:hypothetical protein
MRSWGACSRLCCYRGLRRAALRAAPLMGPARAAQLSYSGAAAPADEGAAMVRGLQAPGAAVDAQLAAGRIRVFGRARPLDGDGDADDAEAPGSGAPPRRLLVTRARAGRAATGMHVPSCST